MKKINIDFYGLILCLVVSKGLVLGMNLPEALVGVSLVAAMIYRHYLRCITENKKIEAEKEIENNKVRYQETLTNLTDRIKSLESKMTLHGISKRR